MSPQRNKPGLPRAIYWLTAVAFALRLVVRIDSNRAGFFQSGYSFFFEMAQNIATGHGISYGGSPTAFRVPLYPILLAGLTLGREAFWPVAIAQSLIGAATVLGAALLSRQVYGAGVGRKVAVLASAITAVYPYYVVHDTALQETSLFTLLTLLAVLSLNCAARAGGPRQGALSGLLLGLDVLTRATIAPFAAFAVLWLTWRKRTTAALWCALLLSATLAPWLLRSYHLTGTPTFSTETGLQLWTGNNGFLFHYYPVRSSDLSREAARSALNVQDLRELEQLSGNEALTDRWFLRRGLAYMRTHPWITLRDDIRKVAAAFAWLPSPRHSRTVDLVNAVSYGPVMLLGLWGMWGRRSYWRDGSLIYALFVTFILVTAVFFAQTAHRSYLDVYWIAYAAGTLVARMHSGAPYAPSDPAACNKSK